MRQLDFYSLALGMMLLAGCHQICEPEKTDRELLDQYGSKGLHEVYAMHARLCDCFPPRTTLSARLADFGPAGKRYALSTIKSGDLGSFVAASSTVSAVNSKYSISCTRIEFNRLRAAARELRVLPEAKNIYIGSAADACYASSELR
jgi:hypothetical protein